MRLFIYPKDIVLLTGRSLDWAERMYNSLLDSHGKKKVQGLTIKEYSSFHGLDESDVKKALKIQ